METTVVNEVYKNLTEPIVNYTPVTIYEAYYPNTWYPNKKDTIYLGKPINTKPPEEVALGLTKGLENNTI